ncbi:MAG: autotransporter-associated beta strand repeat-containing protein [Pirellulales bacterium]|nr:autotransporter-associated beta strand repeat-containing protein [Pirellulales bacterium]
MNATRNLLRLFALAASLTMAARVEAQTTLYTDSFGGGAVPLNGVLVQGGTLQTGSIAWSANSAFLANGTISLADEGSAILPFTPQVNATYTLTMDVNNPSTQWIALGFKGTPLTSPGTNFTNDRFANGNGYAWMLYRDHATDPTQDIQLFGGANTANPIADNDVTFNNAATNQLKIVLDTTGAGTSFTADFFLNGVSVTSTGLPVTIAQPITAINYVGLSYDNTALVPVTFDNFLLTELITGPVVNQWNVNGGGVFGTAGNWTMGAPLAGSTVQFGSVLTAPNSPATVTLNAPASLAEVQFSNAGASYDLAGPSTLTLTGARTINGIAGTHEISAVIAGTAGLVKAGGGNVYLSANNTYTGTTDVQGGTLRLRTVGAVDGDVTVQSGAALYFSGDAAASGAGYNGAFANSISGAGDVQLDSTLTTETVTFATAKTYAGVTTVAGGTLALSGAGTLGASDGTAASRTVVTGNETTGKIALSGGIAVGNEVLVLNAREFAALNAPHLTSAGANSWAGNIKGDVGGSNYNIVSTSGTLTLAGTMSAPDAGVRNFVFDGAGNVNVTGKIVDLATGADGVPTPGPVNANNNVNVIKRGSGTLTIRTGTNSNDDFWLGTTTVEAGTLEVISDGANNGELKSGTIAVRAGAVLDVDHFGSYDLQIGQTLTGAGTVLATGKTVAIYSDNVLTPGDNGVGTLSIVGAASLTNVGPGGALNYELGNTTAVGGTENDLVSISGALTTSGASPMAVNVRAVEGTLATGNYRLISHAGGATDASGFTPQVFDNLGAVLNPRQTLSTSGATAGQVNLVVSGSAGALTWNGTAGNQTWDVNVSSNWTGGPQFRDLDQTTFGAGGVKNVTVNTRVTPGSTTFSGGVGSTYTLTGTGGITGYGAVNVNNGTVKLFNTGNNYAGTTTVAGGARLEAATMTSGNMVVNGTLAVKNNLAVSFVDDFSTNLSAYTSTRILDANGGGSNTYTWEINNGAVRINTTAYDGIEQTALTRTDHTLAIGQELRAAYEPNHLDTQDIGLYVGAGHPTADVRANYVAMYVRNNGQVFTRGFNGTTEFGLAGGATPADIDSIFITRTSADTFQAGYYENGARVVLATRVIENGNAAGIGNSIGLYSDVRGVGLRGSLDNLSISSGSASHVTTVAGDLSVAATGTLEFDLSSLGYTSLDVTGAATFASGATVAVNLLDGFMPAEGSIFSLVDATGGITASSLNFNLPALAGGLAWDTSAFVASGDVSVVASGLAGDFNDSGFVDGSDFLAWQRNNGVGNLADWQTNYGAGNPSTPNLGAVPEPASLLLAALCLGGLLASARRGKQ